MNYSHKQQGFGFFSFMYHAAIIAMVAYLIVLLAPIYLEHRAVKEAMDSIGPMNVVSVTDSLPTAKANIANYLAENFRMNNVVHVSLEHMDVSRNSNGLQVHIVYHVQKQVFANLDLVVNFDNQVAVIL